MDLAGQEAGEQRAGDHGEPGSHDEDGEAAVAGGVGIGVGDGAKELWHERAVSQAEQRRAGGEHGEAGSDGDEKGPDSSGQYSEDRGAAPAYAVGEGGENYGGRDGERGLDREHLGDQGNSDSEVDGDESRKGAVNAAAEQG